MKNKTIRTILRSTSKKSMFLTTVQSTGASGSVMQDTVTESRYGRMAPSTKVGGATTRHMDGGNSGMRTGTCLMGSGRRTRHTGEAYMFMSMGPSTRANGTRISSMGRD